MYNICRVGVRSSNPAHFTTFEIRELLDKKKIQFFSASFQLHCTHATLSRYSLSLSLSLWHLIPTLRTCSKQFATTVVLFSFSIRFSFSHFTSPSISFSLFFFVIADNNCFCADKASFRKRLLGNS